MILDQYDLPRGLSVRLEIVVNWNTNSLFTAPTRIRQDSLVLSYACRRCEQARTVTCSQMTDSTVLLIFHHWVAPLTPLITGVFIYKSEKIGRANSIDFGHIVDRTVSKSKLTPWKQTRRLQRLRNYISTASIRSWHEKVVP